MSKKSNPRKDRFAYEEAEGVLDGWIFSGERAPRVQRAYRKFKCVLVISAYVDYSTLLRPDEVALSYAWEEAQVTFAGRGDGLWMGALFNLWVNIPSSERDEFGGVVLSAFEAAERATSPEVERIFPEDVRRSKPCRPDKDLFIRPIMPATPSRLREWINCPVDKAEEAIIQQWIDQHGKLGT